MISETRPAPNNPDVSVFHTLHLPGDLGRVYAGAMSQGHLQPFADALMEHGHPEHGEALAALASSPDSKLTKFGYTTDARAIMQKDNVGGYQPHLLTLSFHPDSHIQLGMFKGAGKGDYQVKKTTPELYNKLLSLYAPEAHKPKVAKLASYKSPAGGTIVNNQYFDGGSFIPKVLGKIRDVMTQWRAGRVTKSPKAKLARDPQYSRTHTVPIKKLTLNKAALERATKHVDAGQLSKTEGPLHVWLTENKKLLLVDGYHRLADGLRNKVTSVPIKVIGRGKNDYWTEPPEDNVAKLKHKIDALAPMSGKDLVPSATYASGALSDRQIGNIERAHGVPPLKRRVTAEGRVQANSEDIAKFFDNIAEKRLSHTGVLSKLRDPNTDDNEKMAHLVNHMTDEAGHARRKSGGSNNWYSGDIDKLDHAIGTVHGWEPDDHRVTLAKAVIALTSKDQMPVPNVMTAMRVLDDAKTQHPEQPFHHLRPFNYPGYEKWLSQAKEFAPEGTDIEHVGRPEDAYQWYKNWGQVGERGYMTAPTIVDRKTDTPMGRKSGASFIPFNGFTKEQLVQAVKSKAAKIVGYTPKVGPDGRTVPKAWGPASSISGHLGILRNLVTQLGEKGAAKFLTDSHDISELKKLKTTVDRGDTDKGEPLSGAYLFGPKFGPFFENMNKQHDKLTADKWWSRTWNRALGTMYDAANGEQTTPRSTTERRMMNEAAGQAAKKLNLSKAELQAVLWYHEQHLHRQFGATNESQSFADAAEHLLKSRGHSVAKPDEVPF